MKMPEVRTIARKKGVNAFGKTKEALIREIQKAEQFRDCFNRGESASCGQRHCSWRSDCK
ncbi:MAG: SAP domain-containing protein [Planctomycetes bacterium]|nr:SAP domain-containing protein [Planctomycetota bacterium]